MKNSPKKPVLIANRGEIAIRIARTCRALGYPTVMVYSDADRLSEHIEWGDQAYHIGASAPQESYLNVPKLMEVIRKSGAGFVHPGYGFLSEREHFVKACQENGVRFVGPAADSMYRMGDKIRARMTIDEIQVPRIPGSPGALKDAKDAKQFAEKIGYPVLLKASAGGGGKGMRRVNSPDELESAFEGATREALSAFGDGSVYIEKWIVNPHHIEIQVFGDGKGGAVHLGERECSIQRRYQKVFEETPSPLLDRFPKTRERMFQEALKITSHIQYSGAGTLEFVADEEGNFYFLEMNTRLQVEHPVSEWVTGVDLVEWQILLAAGEFQLPSIPERRGHSIEVRLYAEDPSTFLPSPGLVGDVQFPTGAFVRTDTAFSRPGEVSMFYDPMIAKISVWAPNRQSALARMRVALDETRVIPPTDSKGIRQGSLQTNLKFLKRLLRNKDLIGGNTPTDLIAKNPDLTQVETSEDSSLEAGIATALISTLKSQGAVAQSDLVQAHGSMWARVARHEGIHR